MLPIATQTLLSELESIEVLAKKWADLVSHGVPGIDVPLSGNATEMSIEAWLTELIGELRMISGKSHNLSEVLAATVLG